MNSIKFRCWNKEERKWVKYFWIDEAGVVGEDCGYNSPATYINDKCIIEQFTGLYDFKQNPIYESDILKIENFLFYVTFDNGCFVVKEKKESEMNFALSNINIFSIIVGNIHENLQFLESNK